jgi:hypothetical protein
MSLDILGSQEDIAAQWYTKQDDGTYKGKHGLEIMVMFTMILGVPEITEKTAPLFWERIYLYQKAIGPAGRLRADDGTLTDWFITPEIVREFIGLRTNVSPRTNAQFWKLIGSQAGDDSTREWRKDQQN